MSLLADLRHTLRQYRRTPGFAITAVLTLALGIGATTAVFSVAYGVLIDPFPYHDVHTLATPKLCMPDQPECNWRPYTPEQFNEIVQKTDIFSGITASTVGNVTLTGAAVPQQVRGNYLSPNTFSVLGVQPLLGRPSTEDDVLPGHGEVALLSYRYWQQHFGGNPKVLGTVLTVDGRARTVIGVMPPRFLWRGGDIYLPVQLTNAAEIQGQHYFTLVGRLKPGVTDAQAAAELKPIFDDFRKSSPNMFPAEMRLGVMPFDQMFRSGLGDTLHLLLGAVFILLLIACVNVSSLLLARAVGREHEFALRASLGASPWRLARSALTESMVLALGAMPIALLFAYAGLQAMLSIVPKDTIPDEAVVTMNIPVLLISLAIAVLTVLIFGSAPAWRSASPHPASALQGNSRTSASRAQRRLLGGFVITEIALSFALLALAGLMVRSLITVENVPISADPDHTLVFSLPLTSDRYPTPESQVLFFRQFLERAGTVPGVRSVSIDGGTPFLYWDGVKVQVPGQPVDKLWRPLHLVDPGYLQAAGRTMIEGHFIDTREIDAKSHDIVISQSFVRQYFGGGSVLGKVVHLPGLLQNPQTVATPNGHPAVAAVNDDSFTIVGVVKDATASLIMGHLNPPEVFVPYSVAPQRVDAALVQTALPPKQLIQSFRRLVAGIDKDQPIADAMSLRQLLDMYGYAGPRFALALFGAFAVAGLLLACIGVYSVLSFVTSQRTQEIGIRIALGARRPHVMWIVLRQACLWSAAGVAIGLPLALVAGHFAQAQLFHTSPYDPLTLVAAGAILPLLAIAGTCLPASRAASINPVGALRAE